MNRLLLTAILAVLLWCGIELHDLNHARRREGTASPRTSGTTVFYYVPDGTCITVPNPEGDQERHAQ